MVASFARVVRGDLTLARVRLAWNVALRIERSC